jgi:glycosyltransferase involved in cell wall biosynthesis
MATPGTGELQAKPVTPAVARQPTTAGAHPPRYDAFIDLTGTGAERLRQDDQLADLGRYAALAAGAARMTVALRADAYQPSATLGFAMHSDPSQSATMLLARAIRGAAAMRRHLVVLLGSIVPTNEVVGSLIEAVDGDPLFATAQPRFAGEGSDWIWPLPGGWTHPSPGSRIARSVLSLVPAFTITPELLAACLVLRWQALAAAEVVDPDYPTTAGALLHWLCETRRRGLRNVVANRVVVPSTAPYQSLYPVLPKTDLLRLRATYPDSALAENEMAESAQRRLEPLLSVAHHNPRRGWILLDCRGMAPYHNGSAQSMLGYLEGFAALDCAKQIDLLVAPDAARFHRLAERYPGFGQLKHHLTGEYAAAISLTQPWTMHAVADLHRHALLIVFTMLDAIAWDVLYPPGASELGPIWRFVARHADGLLYNSYFTRGQFRRRFPPAPGVAEAVTHHSLLQHEHVDPAVSAEPVADHILVFGNTYDHKDLQPTVRLLADAFPFDRIVAFGLTVAPAPNVVAIRSGQVGHVQLHRLIAGARAVVYPSFSEGFGLPVVEGLAYGRPVIVRRSPLWAEIAGWSRLPGQLIEFDDAPSLVDAVGRALAGLPVRSLPSGVALGDGERPAGWQECARRALTLVNDCLTTADGGRWHAREDALRVTGV